MKHIIASILAGVACLVGLAHLAWADNADSTRARMGEVKNRREFHKMVDESAEVYRTIVNGDQKVSSNVLANARCIAVLPNVITGALVVGGTHGNGLASCKNGMNKWSQPAPISLNKASIGLQAGAKSTDLVLFFQTAAAESALKRGSFTFGTDVSAVAGKYDTAMDSSSAGVIVYSRTEGAFAGAAITDGKIGKDADDIKEAYGRPVDYVSLLEGKETPDSAAYTNKLTSLFPS